MPISCEGVKRYSDDGEPQGTAGVPMLDCIEKEGLVDVAVVVTRYFGGILLGAGGLVRAYSHGAKIAVDAAKRKLMTTCTLLSLERIIPSTVRSTISFRSIPAA